MIKSTIYLFNIKNIQDQISGQRVNEVEHTKKILGEIGQVGTNTYWNATSANVALTHTIEIQYKSYNQEKYLAFRSNGKLRVLTANNSSAGSRSNLIKIHCTETESNIEEMIIDVIERELSLE